MKKKQDAGPFMVLTERTGNAVRGAACWLLAPAAVPPVAKREDPNATQPQVGETNLPTRWGERERLRRG